MAGTQNAITQAKAAGLKATFIDMRSACSRARLHQKTDGADHCDGCASVRAPIRCYVASVSLSPDVCVCMSMGVCVGGAGGACAVLLMQHPGIEGHRGMCECSVFSRLTRTDNIPRSDLAGLVLLSVPPCRV